MPSERARNGLTLLAAEPYRARQFWVPSSSDEARSMQWFRSWTESYHDTV
jgi:hypothetical protein